MRFLGFLLLAFASGVMVYEKISLMRQRAAEYTATHSLLVYVKGALASERRTPAEALLGFGRGELGEALPWLKCLDTWDRVNSFLRERELLTSETALDYDDKAALSDFFFDFGKHTAEEELSRLSGIIELFEKRAKENSAAAQKDEKSLWILFVTVALGVFILIL